MCPVNLAWVNKENKNSNFTLSICQENCNDFRDTDSWLRTMGYRTLLQSNDSFSRTWCSQCLCQKARAYLHCLSLKKNGHQVSFIFQGSKKRSSAALFIKHELRKIVCSLVLMSAQSIFIISAWRDKKSLFYHSPQVSFVLFLSLCLEHSCLI